MKKTALSLRSYLLRHVLIPIGLGMAIYGAWGDESIRVFDWIDRIGVGSLAHWFRSTMTWVLPEIPDWMVFNLPDALWAYGCCGMMTLIWHEGRGHQRLIALSAVLALAIISEVGQAAGLVAGTFDGWDLVAYAMGFVFSLIVAGPIRKEENLLQ